MSIAITIRFMSFPSFLRREQRGCRRCVHPDQGVAPSRIRPPQLVQTQGPAHRARHGEGARRRGRSGHGARQRAQRDLRRRLGHRRGACYFLFQQFRDVSEEVHRSRSAEAMFEAVFVSFRRGAFSRITL